MKLAVVALDFDGTVSDAAGQLDGSVRNTLAELARGGIA